MKYEAFVSMKDARRQQNKVAKKRKHECIVKKKGSKAAPSQISQGQNEIAAASITAHPSPSSVPSTKDLAFRHFKRVYIKPICTGLSYFDIPCGEAAEVPQGMKVNLYCIADACFELKDYHGIASTGF